MGFAKKVVGRITGSTRQIQAAQQNAAAQVQAINQSADNSVAVAAENARNTAQQIGASQARDAAIKTAADLTAQAAGSAATPVQVMGPDVGIAIDRRRQIRRAIGGYDSGMKL